MRSIVEVKGKYEPEHEVPRVIVRPSNRLSLDDIVKVREKILKEVEETESELADVLKDIESLEIALDQAEAHEFDKFDKPIQENKKVARRLKRRLDSQTKRLDSINLDVYREAFQVLEHGDPVTYITNTYNRLHLGDTALGKVLLLSVVNTVITNTEGLQPKLSGESGKGKTHAAKTMFHLIENADYKIEGSLSAKSFFYNPDLIDGMIIFSDDIDMSAELESTLKRAMGSFQANTYHNTLIKQVYTKMQLPKRMTWWLTAVNTDYSDELINRLFDVTVDESAEMDSKVANQAFANAEDGADAQTEDDEVQVCRAMLDIIKRQLFKVKIPFGRSISWNVPGDRRNPNRFIALVYGFAVLRHLQREEVNGYTIATKKDFDDAKALYKECMASQVSKLTNAELRLVKWMVKQKKSLTINDIVNGYTIIDEDGIEKKVEPYTKANGGKYTYSGISKMIVGDNRDKKGLDSKIAMKISGSQRDTTYFIEEFKEFSGEVVTLKS